MNKRAPFFGMILGAFDLMKNKGRGVFFALLTFAMISGVFSAFVQRHIDTIETILASQMNVSRDELDELVLSDLNRISSLEMNDLMLEMRSRGDSLAFIDHLGESEKQIGIIYISRVAPYIGLLLLLNCIIAFIAYTYFLLLFSRGSISPYEAASLLPKAVAGQVALNFFMGFRSFLWIPFIGPLMAFYFLPRLALAPVIYASGETGILLSMKRSIERTSGSWLTIVLRIVGVLLIILACFWPALVLTAVIGLFSFKLSYLFWLVTLLGFVAFFSAAQTMLAVMLA